jgi:hypothetical protein
MALRIVEATVSPSFGAIRMLANANLGPVSMNARISRGFVSVNASAILGPISMFVNTLGIHFASRPQIVVIIGEYQRRLVVCFDRFGAQLSRTHLWNACPYR